MPDARQSPTDRSPTVRTLAERRSGLTGLIQNGLFALAFGFAAAVVFGFVN